MITKIIHAADIHIKKSSERHFVHRNVFQQMYDRLIIEQPDRICIVGDLYHNFLDLSTEAEVLMGEFLIQLSKIAKVIITRGNHDIQKTKLTRVDIIKAITTTLDNPNIVYYDESGFYEDENIVWVVHHHKGELSPWKDIPHIKDESKIYIDLFHDPIDGALGDNMMPLHNNKWLLEDLLGDFNFLGDIHLRQSWREGKTRYCGSILQNSYGEKDVTGHGYLIWNITDKDTFDVEEIDIPNPYNFINLKITKDYDYDNIDLDDENITPHSEIKVGWVDYGAYVNFENETKIRQYIKAKWDIDKVIFDRENIITDISELGIVNEGIDVLDSNEQQKIFKEFLTINKFDDDFIKSILDIDNKINNRLTFETNLGITWSIKKVFFNNFKSYGEDNVIDWDNDKTLWQLTGKNQGGKSTLIDAISYIIFGRTIYTQKREKFGDSRFINNKLDNDYVNGGAVIDVNGEKFTIVRETIRKYSKTRSSIVSCVTTVDYYKGEEITEENKLNGEQKSDTQRLMDSVIGDFDMFCRLAVVNADTLNDLLSIDRASFLNALISDVGLDIFDKKLAEFKDYRSDILKSRKKINVKETEEVIEDTELLIGENATKNKSLDSVISKLEKTLNLHRKLKESKIKQLEKIDEAAKDFNLERTTEKLKEINKSISKIDGELNSIGKLKKDVNEYDATILRDSEDKLQLLKDDISKLMINRSDISINVSELNSEIKILNNDITNITNNFTNELNSKNKSFDLDVMKIKGEFATLVNDYLSETNQKISDLVEKQSIIHTDIDRLMEDGKKLKTENSELEHSSICITCKRALDDVDMAVIEEKISKNRDAMEKIKGQIRDLKPSHTILGEEISKLRSDIVKIKSKNYSFNEELASKYETAKEEISIIKEKVSENVVLLDLVYEKNTPKELRILIDSILETKTELLAKNSIFEAETNIIGGKLDKIEIERDELITKVSNLKESRDEIDKKKEVISNESNFIMEKETHKSTLRMYNDDIKKYESDLIKIDSNKVIEEEIEAIVEDIDEVTGELDVNKDSLLEHKSTQKLLTIQLKQLKQDLITFDLYKAEDEVMATYMKCVHRDGLPTYLLKKSINVINNELYKLLVTVDFTVFFDDELNLRLSADNRLDVSQNAIESSGMERTFIAVALKMALRTVNKNSKPNFILLDEIMGKLVDENVEKFLDLLDVIKKQIDKLVIIEHIHPINYDVLVNVEKDIEGISSLKIDY